MQETLGEIRNDEETNKNHPLINHEMKFRSRFSVVVLSVEALLLLIVFHTTYPHCFYLQYSIFYIQYALCYVSF